MSNDDTTAPVPPRLSTFKRVSFTAAAHIGNAAMEVDEAAKAMLGRAGDARFNRHRETMAELMAITRRLNRIAGEVMTEATGVVVRTEDVVTDPKTGTVIRIRT